MENAQLFRRRCATLPDEPVVQWKFAALRLLFQNFNTAGCNFLSGLVVITIVVWTDPLTCTGDLRQKARLIGKMPKFVL
jgi:hypothetical protein